MNEEPPLPKYAVSAGKIDQTVCPGPPGDFPVLQEKSATSPSIWSPRCSRYQRASAFGSFALKKMPPIPVTRTRRFRAAIDQEGRGAEYDFRSAVTRPLAWFWYHAGDDSVSFDMSPDRLHPVRSSSRIR